ncbi:MAG: hypothetical protein RIS47_861, partial [Bacteroidota bacterium]
MGLSDFFMLLTPKDKKFIPLYVQQIEVVERAAGVFEKLLRTSDLEVRLKLVGDIKELEREGDRFTLKIFEELNLAFITPFDRDDIYLLANEIDSVIDYMNQAAKQIKLYNFEETYPEFDEMA